MSLLNEFFFLKEAMVKKILVVDDEVEVCNLIRDILETEGFEADVSYSGKECLQKVNEDGYSALLLDIMMPGLSGEDVLKLLRKEGEKIPVVYVTIKPKAEIDTRKVDGFVQKPFKNEELIDVVKSVVS